MDKLPGKKEATSPKKSKPETKKKDFFETSAAIVGKNYALISSENWQSSENRILDLLNQRCMPKEPFDRVTIEMLLNKI